MRAPMSNYASNHIVLSGFLASNITVVFCCACRVNGVLRLRRDRNGAGAEVRPARSGTESDIGFAVSSVYDCADEEGIWTQVSPTFTTNPEQKDFGVLHAGRAGNR